MYFFYKRLWYGNLGYVKFEMIVWLVLKYFFILVLNIKKVKNIRISYILMCFWNVVKILVVIVIIKFYFLKGNLDFKFKIVVEVGRI